MCVCVGGGGPGLTQILIIRVEMWTSLNWHKTCSMAGFFETGNNSSVYQKKGELTCLDKPGKQWSPKLLKSCCGDLVPRTELHESFAAAVSGLQQSLIILIIFSVVLPYLLAQFAPLRIMRTLIFKE
jgi:hypothetical protein